MKKMTKIVEIKQVSPGHHFIVRFKGDVRVLARPSSVIEAEAIIRDIGIGLRRLGLDYSISY